MTMHEWTEQDWAFLCACVAAGVLVALVVVR